MNDGRKSEANRCLWHVLLVSLVLELWGCAAGRGSELADPPSEQAVPSAAREAATDSQEYIIGPGDSLKVIVAQNAELNTETPVRPDGKISTPLARDVVAVGKTPTQLSQDIESALSRYVREPSVSVIVSNPVGALGQVKIVGRGVPAPKALPYRSGMTVLDLVLQTGGLSQFAAGNRAKIIRVAKDGTRMINVRIEDLLNRGRVSENVVLQPGDMLVIPEAWF